MVTFLYNNSSCKSVFLTTKEVQKFERSQIEGGEKGSILSKVDSLGSLVKNIQVIGTGVLKQEINSHGFRKDIQMK